MVLMAATRSSVTCFRATMRSCSRNAIIRVSSPPRSSIVAFRSEATKAGVVSATAASRSKPGAIRSKAAARLSADCTRALGEWRHVGQLQVGSEQLRFPPGLPEHVLVVDVELAVEVVDGGRDLRHRLARGPGLGHIPLQRAAERRFAVPDRVSDGVGGRPALREGAHPGDVVAKPSWRRTRRRSAARDGGWPRPRREPSHRAAPFRPRSRRSRPSG